ncbi:MAG: phage tail sheath subtilisin-like domain-containing protein [Saprospiraceae bacterium]|nr:phage tail sheath subtilisin-like domain-containing protein [Saprospiraceae bacterium]
MSGIYKTPGVYVEEIPKFPPSIAPVETAIPAFIGYTEKAIKNGQDITGKPTRIESIVEYETIFGGAPPQDVTVYLDSDNNFARAETDNSFYLYDSLRMFYANGGGNCYIVSAGGYASSSGILQTEIEKGIKALELEDEPTIILLPDAVSLGDPGLYNLQQTALDQCNRLMDRVVVCDLVKNTDTPAFSFKDSVDDFRDKIGIKYLKYGAAYGPWINSGFPRQLSDKNIKLIDSSNNPVNLESLTTDAAILNIIANLKAAKNAGTVLSVVQTFEADLQDAVSTFPMPGATLTAYELALKKFSSVLEAVFTAIETVQQMNIAKNIISKFLTDVPALKTAVSDMISFQNGYTSATSITFLDIITPSPGFEKVMNVLAPLDLTVVTPALPGTNDDDDATAVRASAETACLEAINLYNALKNGLPISTIAEEEKYLNDALLASFGKFKEFVAKAATALNLLPPSGAVAGVYASVDRERGVWKAPANVSLNAVIGPAVKISHEQQAEYNVDVNAGKSINIIRSFTGKGTLVWGARTLAGNDNEWRYISVRRFFNFVEESVKKATEQFVFEPNDANTWVRVQAMIENFLNTLWRQGALQGVKPEHAFYVAVGLGKTMTPLDILEGRMIIEIGMAAVRPAEFIILRFSHKMAES